MGRLYIYLHLIDSYMVNVDVPGTQMTLVLIGKGLVLEG